MPQNKTLTPEEKDAVIKDAMEWACTVLHNALKYCGARTIKLTGTVTGPDGNNYSLEFKPKGDA